MASGPLAGIRVIEIGQALAGPYAGVILAEMGAEVIKIEKPEGGDDARRWGPPFVEGDAVTFRALNRGKRSVTLDLKRAEDVAALKALARDWADILIQNLRPGVVEELGIGPEAMLAENPRLIYCSIWAFGHSGPLRNAPGFDPLAQAYGAVMTLTGRPEDPPTFSGAPLNDKASAMWCVIGALAALQRRQATGKGGVIDTSLFEAAVGWVETPLNHYAATGRPPKRHGTASAVLVPYQVFETADRPMVVAVGNDRLFVKFAEALGHPEWARDPRFAKGPDRAANREALIALIVPLLRERTRADWLERLGAAGVPCSPVNDIPELAASEQLAAMDMVRYLPGSGMKVMGLPLSFERQRPHPRGDSPRLGEHTAEVLGRVGAPGDTA
ncbi:MAG: CoA transferase [Acetobacteraceae bacterium]|nr:CoA transferase [Acetobacteraceae bacterium]